MRALRTIRLTPLRPAPTKPTENGVVSGDAFVSLADVTASKPEEDAPKSRKVPIQGTCPCCELERMQGYNYNRVSCHACGAAFCWLCGVEVNKAHEAYATHFQWWNPFGCRDYFEKPSRLVLGDGVWRFLFALMATLPSFALATLLAVLTVVA